MKRRSGAKQGDISFHVHPSFYRYWKGAAHPKGLSQRDLTRRLARLLEVIPPQAEARLLRRNRRGQLESIALPIYLLLAAIMVVVAVVVAGQASDSLDDVLNDGGVAEMPGATEKLGQVQVMLDSSPGILNFGFIGLAIVFGIGLIWVSALVPSHPLLAVIVLPTLLIGGYMSMTLGNAWDDFLVNAEPTLSARLTLLPGMNWLLTHSLEYFILVALLSAIAFYAAFRQQGFSVSGGGGGGGFG